MGWGDSEVKVEVKLEPERDEGQNGKGFGWDQILGCSKIGGEDEIHSYGLGVKIELG